MKRWTILLVIALLYSACQRSLSTQPVAQETPIATRTPDYVFQNGDRMYIQHQRCPGDFGTTDYTVVVKNQDSEVSCGADTQQPYATLDDGTRIYFWVFLLEDLVPRWYNAADTEGTVFECIGMRKDGALERSGVSDLYAYGTMACDRPDDQVHVYATTFAGTAPSVVGWDFDGHMNTKLICDTGHYTVRFTGTPQGNPELIITPDTAEPYTRVLDGKDYELCLDETCFVRTVFDNNMYVSVWSDVGIPSCLDPWMQPTEPPEPAPPQYIPYPGEVQTRLNTCDTKTVGRYFQLMPPWGCGG